MIERIEKIVFQSCVVLKGKVDDWKKALGDFRRDDRYKYRKLFEQLVGSADILDKPYTYVIFLNGEPIYVGETRGGQENRGIAIWAIIVGASSGNTPLENCLKNKIIDNDEIGIFIISTRNKGIAKILERVLIVGLPLERKDKPDCNND